MNHLGDVIQAVDAAVGAQGPVGLVLHAGDMFRAVGFVPGVRALDDAPGTAGMVVEFLAQTLLVPFKDRFAGDLGRPFKPSVRKVACRQAARLVENIDQHGRPIGVQGALGLGDIMGPQRLVEFLLPLVKQSLVSDGDPGSSFAVHHDELEPFAGHHGAQAAASGKPARPLGNVVIGDARVSVTVLARHTASRHGNPSGKPLVHFRKDFIQVLACILVGWRKLHLGLAGPCIPGQASCPVFSFLLRVALDDHRLDLHRCQGLGPGGAGVGFLDAPCERRLGPRRNPRRCGSRGPGHNSRGKDKLIVGTQGVTLRRDLFSDKGGRYSPAAEMLVGRGSFLQTIGTVSHVHSQNPHNVPSFLMKMMLD